MSLYRLTTGRPPTKSYAIRTGSSVGDEPVIAWVRAMNSSTLFKRSDALKLAKRMKRVVKVKLERAA